MDPSTANFRFDELEQIAFKGWLSRAKFFSRRSSQDVCSRLKRAERLLGRPLSHLFEEISLEAAKAEIRARLLGGGQRNGSGGSVFSDLTRALSLYHQFSTRCQQGSGD